MLDTNYLESVVHAKAMDKAFSYIVCESFITSFSKATETALPDNLIPSFAFFTQKALEDVGGHKLLLNAIENHSLTLTQHAYLQQVKSICMEAASTLTERIVSENKDDVEALQDAAAKMAFTKEEMTKIAGGVDKIVNDELTDLIKTKVMDTIDSEREAYQQDAELEESIIQALKDADMEDHPAGENPVPDMQDTGSTAGTGEIEANEAEKFDNFMRQLVGRNYQASHQTVFSKIQEMCYESLLYTKETDTQLPLATITGIARENILPVFESHLTRNTVSRLDTMSRYAMESDVEPTAALHEKSLFATKMIYTFFEVLSTMNLFTVSRDDVKNFIESASRVGDRMETEASAFMKELPTVLGNARESIDRAANMDEINRIVGVLQTMATKVSECEALTPDMKNILSDIGFLIESASDKYRQLEAAAQPAPVAIESAFEVLARTRDINNFSRAASSMGKKPNVHTMRFRIDPQAGPKARMYVAVEAYNALNEPVGKSTIVLESARAVDNLEQYVASSIKASSLPELAKKITLNDMRNSQVYYTHTPYSPSH